MNTKSRLPAFGISILLGVLILLGNPASALAATSGPSAGSTFSSVTSGSGSVSWTSPGNAGASDANYATANLGASLGSNETSHYLQATGFNFAIPAGATINGIQASVTKKSSAANDVKDNHVYLLKGGVLTTTDKKNASAWTTSDAATSYGGVADLWGTTWTAADVNASNFGFALSAINSALLSTRTASVNYITLTVTYTPVSGPLTSQTITVTTHAPAAAVNGTTFPVVATASSALPVTITVTGGCSISSGTVTMTSATNACVVHYNQAGNGTFAAAPEVLETTTASAAAPACSIAVATNKIANPCFETGTGNAATSWVADDSTLVGTGAATITNIGTHSGIRAGQVSVTAYTSGDIKWAHQSVAVTPGQYYTFSNWYKSDVPTEIDIAYNGNDFQWISALTPAADWTQYQTSFIVPAGVTSIQVLHILSSVGTLTTDDYSLVQGTAPVFPEGRVTLTFDDGWKSFFTNGIPVLNSFGLKASAYINTEPITGEFNGYMTAADVIALQNQGHDIGGHTTTHADLTLPTTNLTSEINDNRSFLMNTATTSPVDTFAYPYGAYNDAVIAQLQSASYIGARTVDDGFNFSNSDKFKLKIKHVTNVTSTSTIQGWVSQALADKTWLILMFHEIVGNNGVGGDCIGTDLTECATTSTLQDISNYLYQNYVCVLTMNQALHDVPCNKAPVLDGIGAKSVVVNNPLTFTAHATDANALDTISYSLSLFPAGATISSTTGVFSWTPNNASPTTTSATIVASDGKGGTDSETITITVLPDNVPPTVTLVTSAASSTNLALIPVTATFSESVTGFTLADVASSTTGGNVSDFLGSGSSYSFNIVPTADGVISVSLPADSARDLADNASVASSPFSLISDRTKPVVTLIGLPVKNITTADAYVEEGASVTDNLSVSLTAIITGSVNTALPGTYPLQYNAVDAAGNHADEVVRTVNVSDASAPVFSAISADITAEATSTLGVEVSYTPPVATDDVDGVVAVECLPASLSVFPLGNNVVSCSAVDLSGNIGRASFLVRVVDTIAPSITPPADQTFEATGAMTLPTFDMAVATDTVDITPVVSHYPSEFPVGTSTVTWKATDASGNESVEVTSMVTITDTTAPEISSPGEVDVVLGNPFSDPVTASDLVDGDLTASLILTGDAINVGVIGTYNARYNVSDAAGNAATEKTLTVRVTAAAPTGGSNRGNGGGNSGGGGRINPFASTTPAATAGQVLGASLFKFTLTTSVGSTGNEVTELQKRLTSEGVYTGPISGYFGVLTQTGVKAYQGKYGIEPVGIVGPKTRSKLNGELAFTAPNLGSMTMDQMKALLVQLQVELAELLKKAGGVTMH